ncbi:MAG: cell division protein FtsQ/DivIB [Desulfonatronovibrionaceae bacterium]
MSVAVSRYRKNRAAFSTSRPRSGSRSRLADILGLIIAVLKIAAALVVVLGFSLLILFGYREVVTSSLLALKKIEITGNEHLRNQEVLAAAQVEPGDNLAGLNISDIKSRLKENPWVSSVIVTREFPDRLTLTLSERQACFWVKKGEKLFYADQNGETIAPVRARGFVSLPLLYSGGDSARLKEVVKSFQQGKMPFSLQQVAWARVTGSGSVIFGLRDREMQVEMDTENWPQSVGRLGRVWDDLEARGELGGTAYLGTVGDIAWVEFKKRTG